MGSPSCRCALLLLLLLLGVANDVLSAPSKDNDLAAEKAEKLAAEKAEKLAKGKGDAFAKHEGGGTKFAAWLKEKEYESDHHDMIAPEMAQQKGIAAQIHFPILKHTYHGEKKSVGKVLIENCQGTDSVEEYAITDDSKEIFFHKNMLEADAQTQKSCEVEFGVPYGVKRITAWAFTKNNGIWISDTLKVAPPLSDEL